MNLSNFKILKLNFQSSQGDLSITPTLRLLDSAYPSYWEKGLSSPPTALLYLHYFLEKKSDFTADKIELLTQDELQEISSNLFEKISNTSNLKIHHPSAQDDERIEELKINTTNSIEKFYELAKILEESQGFLIHKERLGALYSPETLASITESFSTFSPPKEEQTVYNSNLNIENPIAKTNRNLDESNEKLMSISMSLRSLHATALNMIAENEENRRAESRKSKVQLWMAIGALGLPSLISGYEIFDSYVNNNKMSARSESQYQQLETQIKNQNNILLELKNQNTLLKFHLEVQEKNHMTLIQQDISNKKKQ